ncbi:hypothetical protein P4H71_17900 [Paenibacillus kribbensis]|uniref:hypothetical protein n=1 Tax=Paenibacillus kribbensis TaxID=172713 RepID=UPI002DBAE52A|nr:hypothetical protein [Paenibacillus kribbensis]MEC0236199.1 hypothetical protein [Paenibacillus kribbensis]
MPRIGRQPDFGGRIATIDALGLRGGNAHTAEEFLDIESLVPRTRLLANLIKRLSREYHLYGLNDSTLGIYVNVGVE